jgi:hypothetical protein
MMGTFFLVFLAYFLIDAICIVYLRFVKEHLPWRSGTAAALMYCLTAYGVVSYTEDPIYILAIAGGSFFGTACAVWWQTPKGHHDVSNPIIREANRSDDEGQ